ncbi:hypothetical protein [Streptomyces sp. TRM68367]|uniref:hypothetical protein n=1 Tax=Streptomyces sp. TRM68367 TaxID=2758415 RepID=UPI00165C280B|nr:hypothetical protein [Streptomyces sp. TRM68367]MBC9728209.1 hypothetical protein [Streptomyces sp. TRM68367]
MPLRAVESRARAALPEITGDLRTLVELETPSDDKELLDHVPARTALLAGLLMACAGSPAAG